MTEFEDFCTVESRRRGIDPAVAFKVANHEGGLAEPAVRGTFPTGSSWWAFQLHYGGPGFEFLGTTAGMGNDFTAITGWQPGDPRAWRDAMRFALDRARRGGWGPWNGAKAEGIFGFDGINRLVPWTGTPDNEWDFKNPNVPPTCAEARTTLGFARGNLGNVLEEQMGFLKEHAGGLAGCPQARQKIEETVDRGLHPLLKALRGLTDDGDECDAVLTKLSFARGNLGDVLEEQMAFIQSHVVDAHACQDARNKILDTVDGGLRPLLRALRNL
jgi:hypothetical protein